MVASLVEHRFLGSQAQKLWCMGLVAPRPVKSSWARTVSPALAGGFPGKSGKRKAEKLTISRCISQRTLKLLQNSVVANLKKSVSMLIC